MNKISDPLRVLVLEDNPNDAELVLHELRRASFQPDATRVDTETEYLASRSSMPDVILSARAPSSAKIN